MATINFAATAGVEISDDATPSGYELIPIGTVILYAGSTEPEGWIFCDGRSIAKSTTTYSNLKTFLEANAYPFGSDASNFNIPNFQSRIPIGYSPTSVGGLSIRTLGSVGGSESHLIDSTKLPPHTHSLGGHTHDGTTGNQSANHAHGTLSGNLNNPSADHTHTLNVHNHTWQYTVTAQSSVNEYVLRNSNSDGTARTWITGGGTGTVTANATGHNHTTVANTATWPGTNPAHNHSFTTGGPSSNLTGDGGLAATPSYVDHMGSFLPLNYIIKY